VTDQCEAAADDHEDDERLEVVVFDEDVGVTAQLPEDAANERVFEHTQQRRTLGRTGLWTALIRVLDEHHVHLSIIMSTLSLVHTQCSVNKRCF